MMSVDERYLKDPQFRQLVDLFFNFYAKAEFTPSEIRDACMLAQIKYESFNPKPVMFSPQLHDEILHRLQSDVNKN
jgi:hypothetical protein